MNDVEFIVYQYLFVLVACLFLVGFMMLGFSKELHILNKKEKQRLKDRQHLKCEDCGEADRIKTTYPFHIEKVQFNLCDDCYEKRMKVL